jgi:hypothetical protein
MILLQKTPQVWHVGLRASFFMFRYTIMRSPGQNLQSDFPPDPQECFVPEFGVADGHKPWRQ